ncbi:MAG: hypothetical protein ACREL1_03885 [bacterium]
MTIAKSRVAEVVRQLPEQVDLDDLMYRLYLLKKIEKGEADIRAKRTVSHVDLLKKIKKW